MASLEDLNDDQKAALMRAGYQLLHNPDVSKDAKRLLKKANPKLVFPELDAEDRINAELKTRDEKIAELEKAQLERDMQARIEEKRRMCRERGLDPADVEALIVERGKAGRMIDWESAAELMELQKQSAPATPAGDTSPATPMMSEKDLWNDPAKWAREQSRAAIDEINRNKRRRA